MLLAASNLRGRHNIPAGIVRNKIVLREEVLMAHKGGGGVSKYEGSPIRLHFLFCRVIRAGA